MDPLSDSRPSEVLIITESTSLINTTDPLVSVLIPCYNAQETVDDAITSIIHQDLKAWELILMDDGSTDSTRGLLQAFAERDGRVRLFHQPHAGIIEALNAGLRLCRAKYIARMDADDLASPHRLGKQVAFLDSNPSIAVVGCLVEGYPPDKIGEGFRLYLEWMNRLTTPDAIAGEIYIESPMAHPSVMVRQSWLELVGGYQEHGWPEDYDLWLRLHLAGAKFAKVPELLISWREHPHRLTHIDPRYSTDSFLRAKAHYLCQGALKDRDALFIWGAGQTGRKIARLLVGYGTPLAAFIDVDPHKIGRKRLGRDVLPPDQLLPAWARFKRPVLLAAVSSRGARSTIRECLNKLGLCEASDWWAVA